MMGMVLNQEDECWVVEGLGTAWPLGVLGGS